MSFFLQDGYLYCEGLRVKDIQKQVRHSPFYLYSAGQIRENYAAYAAAFQGLSATISYAVKANNNLTILKMLRGLGCGATLVSGNELRLALAAGFEPQHMILNGNGKTLDDLRLAANCGAMVNIDSAFDLAHIQQISKTLGRSIDVLLRINPDVDPEVHPYISTGIRGSKFGIAGEDIPWFLRQLRDTPSLNLVGVHCHLGSTIEKMAGFREAAALMVQHFEMIRQQGFDVTVLNMGGGLGIDYSRVKKTFPGPKELAHAIRDLIGAGIKLIIEPGRSIVGNAGVFVTQVIGVKSNGRKHFIVTDGSMAELIRPSLYNAFHEIGFVEPVEGAHKVYDVVGPVCESADFLGKDRALPPPPEGAGLVVYDSGAYGYAMSSNYNARTRPPEYLVDGEQLIQIRRAERLETYLEMFETHSEDFPPAG